MKCEICREDIGETIVNLPSKQPDGKLGILVCLKCAEQSAAYCKKHERPHLGFEDDETTACMLCIEEMVAEKEKEEVFIFDKILEALLTGEKKRLLEWASSVACLTGECEARCVLRALTTKALRLKRTVEELMGEIIEAKSAWLILPEWFF